MSANNSTATLKTKKNSYKFYPLSNLGKYGKIDRLPYSIRILLEAVYRNLDGKVITESDVAAAAAYNPKKVGEIEIPFKPARVILQDFTGVPAVVDLAAMRSAIKRMGGDPKRINPLVPVDLVIDHSVQVDVYASDKALELNMLKEFERNNERYEFLHWGQDAFNNFRVVPPATGIVHQVNLEYLAKVSHDRQRHRVSGHSCWNRLAHDHDQRPRRRGLGCGWHRSRGSHAWPAAVHADARGDRIQTDR